MCPPADTECHLPDAVHINYKTKYMKSKMHAALSKILISQKYKFQSKVDSDHVNTVACV